MIHEEHEVARRPSRFTFYVSLIAHSSWRDALGLAFLGLLTALFFWPVFFAGYWLPHGGGDLVSFLWPQYSFAAETIRSGSIPLSNPHLYSGMPFLADNQSGVLYPVNLLAFLIFPTMSYQVMEALTIFHIWLAGAAMYAAMRLWPVILTPMPSAASPKTTLRVRFQAKGVVRAAALVGAIAYMFNDVMVTHIGNLNLIAVAAWLPLILALFARGLSERRSSWTIGSGVVFAIALLAGHAQMTAITLVGLLAVAVWQVIVASSRRERAKVAGLALLTPLITLGLTAMQLLPSLEMTRYSLRAGLSYDEATAYSLPPAALASTFAPWLFGRGAEAFWGPWERVETMYVGIVPLFLAGFAFTRQRRNSAWFFLGLGVLGLFIALGKYTPVYSWVHTLPVLSGLRVPARFILLSNFSLAALAALGLQRINAYEITLRRSFIWIGLVVVVAALTLFGAYWPLRPREQDWAPVIWMFPIVLLATLTLFEMWRHVEMKRSINDVLIAFTAVELILSGSLIEIDHNDPTLGYQHQAMVDFLKSDGSMFRIENASDAWQPDAALLQGLYDIGGLFNPLGLASYETYRGGMGDRGSPLYNFLGTKYVLANKNQPPGDVSFVPVFNGDPQLDVYLNTKALPRAQLIDRVIGVSSGEEAWQAIHAPDFDPAKAAVIEGAEDRAGGVDQSAGRALAFVSYSNERVELSVRTESSAYLVLSDVYYPGWTATIDDQPTKLYPANFAFRAVLVPAGEHRVAFAFEPTTWQVGVVISALTLLGLLGYGVWRHFRR
jgi:hypothetical protein